MKARKILLIEDDSDDKIIFNIVVKSIDSSIHLNIASNGFEGLEVLKKETENLPDCIFLDINMPVMDGRECLKELKKNSILSTIPVFVLTTSTNPAERAEMLRNGAKDYISKPSEIGQLVEMVSEALKNIQ